MNSPSSFFCHEAKSHKLVDSPLKTCDEIPAFEDAFDTFSLRKFFQEHESTDSQSNFSPRKEHSIPEEFPALNLDDHDFLFSPIQTSTPKPVENILPLEFQVNSNSSPRAYEVHQSSSPQTPKTRPFNVFQSSSKVVKGGSATKQAKNIQIIIHRGNMTLLKQEDKAKDTQASSFIDYSAFIGQDSTLSNPEEYIRNLDYDLMEDQYSPFQKRLRSKKIFKIERTAPRPLPLRLKRQVSSSRISKNSPVSLRIKSTRSQPNCAQENGNTTMLFNFNTVNQPITMFPQESFNCLKTLDENNNFVNYIIPPLRYHGQPISTGKIFNISNH